MRAAYFLKVVSAFFGFLLLLSSSADAATAPGTVIHSQASAYFVDESKQSYTVTSNEVTTLVREVTGVFLQSDQHRWGVEGSVQTFAHLLTNTGNISTRYQVSADAGAQLFTDPENTGQAEEKNKLTGSVTLAPGEKLNLLLQATVKKAGETQQIRLTARVEGNDMCPAAGAGRCVATNNDRLTGSSGVVYEVRLANDANSNGVNLNNVVGNALIFSRRDNNSQASAVEMVYDLPSELEYVSGSALLCDVNGKSCEKLDIVQPDTNKLTFRLNQNQQVGSPNYVPGNNPGHDGQIKFTTKTISGVGKTLYSAADYRFCYQNQPDGCTSTHQKTNYVPLKIIGAAVSLNASPYSPAPNLGEPQIILTAPAGGTVQFTNYLWNRGTDTSPFKISMKSSSFPAGSQYCLSTEGEKCVKFVDKPELLLNDVEPGSNRKVNLLVKLPAAQEGRFTVELKATQAGASSEVSDTTKNVLLKITDSARYGVDLTYQNAGVIDGVGPGPEAKPVATKSGKTLRFDNILVNNTGNRPDNYLLTIVPAKSLPDGIRWSFINELNQTVSNSGVIAPDRHKALSLILELPDNLPGSWSFYVQVTSEAEPKASDQLHLAVTVAGERRITLTPNGTSQVSPGSFVVFTHQLSNSGTVMLPAVALQLENSSADWQSLIYLDVNNDGELDAGDTLIEKPFPLNINESRQLLVKVFAPADATLGSKNITTLTARFGAESVAVTNSATANNAIVVITKTQASWNCSSPLPTNFSNNVFAVKPGECVVYQLTATNQGSEPVQNVVIYDQAPDFTRFHTVAGKLPVVSPDGSFRITGQSINATWKKPLMPGQSVFLQFGVQIQ